MPSMRPKRETYANGRVPRSSILVRLADADDLATNSSTGLVGDPRNDLIPISLNFSEGPQGSTLEVQHPNDLAWKGRRDNKEELESLEGKILSLEMRRSQSNKALQQLLFRGIRSDEGQTWDASPTNALTSTWSDWMIFDNSPLDLPRPDRFTAGALFEGFENGYVQSASVVSGQPTLTTIVFDPVLLPTTADGATIAKVDEGLKALANRIGSVQTERVQFSQVFCDLCRSMGRIPTLEYGGGYWVLTGREPGFEERDLVIGADGSQNTGRGTAISPNCSRLSGSASYRSKFNKVIGYGGKSYRIEPTLLEEDWTDAERTAVLADFSLLRQPKYQHVGRRYRLPEKVRMLSPNVTALDGTGGYRQPRIWSGATESILYLSDASWKPLPIFDSSVNGDVLETSTDTDGEYDSNGVIFDEPQFNINSSGTITSFKKVKMEALIIDGDLTVESDAPEDDDSYYTRTKTVTNPNASKVTFVSYFVPNTTTGLATSSTTAPSTMTRDDSGVLLSQVNDLLESIINAQQNKTLTVGYFDPTWKLGQKITRILDTRGNVLESGLSLYCYGGVHRFTGTMDTEITLSREYQSLLTGRLQNG